MKKIAIIGKPNVGKSSFFNRILKYRDAIVSELSNTTRDFKERKVDILGKKAILIDTGGITEGNELLDKIKEKVLKILEEVDIVLYMVDIKSLIDEKEKKFFFFIQKKAKNLALIINKVDNENLEEDIYNFFELGIKDIFPISVSHNRKINKVLQWLNLKLDNEEIEETNNKGNIKIAIIGRVNTGKSSLLNALIKKDRSIISNIEGTTIDPIDEKISYKGEEVVFVDTAGVRKRGKIMGIEKYALLRTQEILQKADIALLVLDASENFKELDEKIAGFVDKYGLACIIILNKWDIRDKEFKEKEKLVRDKFKFLNYAPIISVSALSSQRVHKIYDLILKVYKNYSLRIQTAKINECIEEITKKHKLPSFKGKDLKIYYCTQYESKPPKIAIIMNQAKGLHFSYKRYIKNKLREKFDLEGTPILLKVKSKND